MQTKKLQQKKKPIDDDTMILGRWRDKRVVELLINMEEKNQQDSIIFYRWK